jgi:hypothetical protein
MEVQDGFDKLSLNGTVFSNDLSYLSPFALTLSLSKGSYYLGTHKYDSR